MQNSTEAKALFFPDTEPNGSSMTHEAALKKKVEALDSIPSALIFGSLDFEELS